MEAAAAANRHLGLSAAEFLDMTPYHVSVYWRHERMRRREEYRPFAMLASLYANTHRDPDITPEPYPLEYFMPAEPGHNQVTAPVDEVEQQRLKLLAWARSQPGAVRRKREDVS